MKPGTVIFASPGWRSSLAELPFSRGAFEVSRYGNGELHIEIKTAVEADECIVVGGVAPPDENLLTISLLAHTLKKDGASRVSAVLPYLGYSRHDKASAGQSLGMAWVGQLLKASGVDEIISLDVHSRQDHDLVPMPLHSISPAGLLAREVPELRSPGVTLVAPDQGAGKRVQDVTDAVGLGRVVHGTKTRSGESTKILIGEPVSGDVVVIDDILDSGNTLVSCCEELKRLGAGRITIAVTHALFSGQRWQRLWELNVIKIYCLDTTPIEHPADPRIIILPSGELVSRFLRQRAKI